MKASDQIQRSILERWDKMPSPRVLKATAFPAFPQQDVAYHRRLLNEKELIDAKIQKPYSGDELIPAAVAYRLTSEGHQRLAQLSR